MSHGTVAESTGVYHADESEQVMLLDVPTSLQYGAMLAQEVAAFPAAISVELREYYQYRLRRIAAYVLEHGTANPEIAEDDRLRDIQAALGVLAIDDTRPPLSPTPESYEPIDYYMALRQLCKHLDAMEPGEQYTLRPAQIATLAAPNMGFSRWQRYRLLKMARNVLPGEGYEFSYNHARGKHAAYVVGRPASP